MSIQITEASGYDTKNMIFSEPIAGSIPNSQIQFKRIMIKTKYPNGKIGDLILPTERLYSFGVNENVSPDTQKVTGYTMPMCMWSKDNCTPEEKTWTDTFEQIVEKCKDHLVEHKEDIEKWDLERIDLKRLNPLYWKKDKGVIVKGLGPKLYPKLIVSRKQEKYNGIITYFYDQDDNRLDPEDLKGKPCFVRSAIKIESIFIGNKISLQVKLFECDVELINKGGLTKLLKRQPKQMSDVKKDRVENPMVDESDNEESDDNDKQENVSNQNNEENEYQSDNEPKEEVQSPKPKKGRGRGRGRGRGKKSKN